MAAGTGRGKKKKGKAPMPGAPQVDMLRELFAQALRFHREEQFDDAEACYRAILRVAPDNADVNCNLGVILSVRGRFDEALECYRRALGDSPGHANARLNLGNALKSMGRYDEALAEYDAVIAHHPQNPTARFNRGVTLKLAGRIDDAAAAYHDVITVDPSHAGAWNNLGIILKDRGADAEAVCCFREAARYEPGNLSVQHLLASLTGCTTEAAPLSYVREIYDAYAPGFDYHLTVNLAYRIPRVLREMCEELRGDECYFRDAVDLGCGTGLAGVEFRAMTDRLTGIDISPKMIEKAQARGIYDVLSTGDLVSFLEKTFVKYDLFIAADVFIYAGDLAPVFAAVRHAAGAGAWFAFSTERFEGDGYTLRRTGRYAHGISYVRTLAAMHGFVVEAHRDEVIRRENGGAIEGDVMILKAP